MADYRTLEQVPRFQLDRRPGRSRLKERCPQCGKERCLTLYIDTVTGQPVGPLFGRCDHERKCGYNRYPTGKDVGDKELWVSGNEVYKAFRPPVNPDVVNYIPNNEWMPTINPRSDNNTLFAFVSYLWGERNTSEIFRRYLVGSIDVWMWKNCPVFWQVDKEFMCRTGKIMEYGIKQDGKGAWVDVKRVKGDGENDYPHVTFYHAMKGNDYLYKGCLFGEHLLNWFPDGEQVNIVESEKTALICAANSPHKLFMATGGLQNLRTETMGVLRGRKIVMFPDKGEALEEWKKKVSRDLYGFDITVSDFLQDKEEVGDGGDMADYLINKKLNGKNGHI